MNDRLLAIYVVVDTDLSFVGMKAMEPAGVLNKCSFPGHRQGQKQCIETCIVKPFSNVTPGCENQPLFVVGNGRQPIQIITASFCASASLQDNQVTCEIAQSIGKVLQVFFAFCVQDRRPTLFECLQDVIEYLIIALLVRCEPPINILNTQVVVIER